MQLNQSIISDIKSIIAQSRDRAIRAVDHQRTLMYWHIGKRIFEEEQEGKDRADYGRYVIKYDNLNIDQIVECYKKYMKFSDGIPPSQKIFLKNMELKMVNREI